MAAYSMCAAASAYCVGVGVCVLVCSSSHLFRTAILMALFFCAGSCLVPEDNNGEACACLLEVLSN
jgi:ferredoxin